ncbi:hypothetical protein [Acinetobacter baumannii]|uniref:hypothetical protein n=1 Tax=Acinetobacter baumannii TaxID=470 RepID=UPI0039058BEF
MLDSNTLEQLFFIENKFDQLTRFIQQSETCPTDFAKLRHEMDEDEFFDRMAFLVDCAVFFYEMIFHLGVDGFEPYFLHNLRGEPDHLEIAKGMLFYMFDAVVETKFSYLMKLRFEEYYEEREDSRN